MRCETVKDCLDALRDGTLGRPEAAEVREHLAACNSCAREWDVTEALRAAIRDRVSVPAAPAAFREAMTRLLERQAAPLGWFARLQDVFRRYPVAAMALAAAMVLLVVVPLNLWMLPAREMVVPLLEESVNEHIRLGLREAVPEIPAAELQPLLARHQRRLDFPSPLSFPDDQEHHLVGGHVSYLLHRKVLTVTYYHRANRPITLVVLPGAGIRFPEQPMSLAGKVYWAVHRGFRIVHWQQGPLIYSLVSDPDEADLSPLVEKLQHRSAQVSGLPPG
ncbi:MAG: zf-HC2 domain-containing protein [candidate division NC10 bacterium]|nr:zf-HC2 domain-containing protein [candidate division NC10 bacterium]MDE2320712.1 zf-HC2 domain-containing protein [candidate division NC10 bacterium]